MVKINFDKYDASCVDNIWTWYIPNRDNTKKIKVVVEFPLAPTMDPLKVEKIYFEEKLDYKKLYIELTEKILKYDHNSYGYIENYNEKYEEYEDLQPGTDGFLSDEQLSSIQDNFKDSSELYKIIRDVYKNAPTTLTDFNKEEK